MSEYFEGYGHLSLQRWMVSDKRRTDAFAAAIAETVKPGDIVIDVGTGTGILAMLAARAGASQVHAVDRAKDIQPPC
jgi:protein arginine N-methyltransferase 1